MSGSEQVIRTQELPILDLSNFLKGQDGDLDLLADQLCKAVEEFGFFFIKNHRVLFFIHILFIFFVVDTKIIS